ncbi:cuticle collagen rol-6 [Trichinella spiralis]|uniref:cuticle collagen rol-6 n=1 Tax=Trichinella spiralis TaxID=6334 RepID=UPI0001EFDB75|nr:cuticle collagen rol-6 [Trichinella spiralis]
MKKYLTVKTHALMSQDRKKTTKDESRNRQNKMIRKRNPPLLADVDQLAGVAVVVVVVVVVVALAGIAVTDSVVVVVAVAAITLPKVGLKTEVGVAELAASVAMVLVSVTTAAVISAVARLVESMTWLLLPHPRLLPGRTFSSS